jgi:hypothetical protein
VEGGGGARGGEARRVENGREKAASVRLWTSVVFAAFVLLKSVGSWCPPLIVLIDVLQDELVRHEGQHAAGNGADQIHWKEEGRRGKQSEQRGQKVREGSENSHTSLGSCDSLLFSFSSSSPCYSL